MEKRKKAAKKFQKNELDKKKSSLFGSSLRDAVANLCEGLTYISETDSPIEPVFFRPNANASLADAIKSEYSINDAEFEESDQVRFFSRLTTVHERLSDTGREIISRFSKLQDLLVGNLEDIKLLRFGRIRINIYVVGFDLDRNVVGISTRAVET